MAVFRIALFQSEGHFDRIVVGIRQSQYPCFQRQPPHYLKRWSHRESLYSWRPFDKTCRCCDRQLSFLCLRTEQRKMALRDYRLSGITPNPVFFVHFGRYGCCLRYRDKNHLRQWHSFPFHIPPAEPCLKLQAALCCRLQSWRYPCGSLIKWFGRDIYIIINSIILHTHVAYISGNTQQWNQQYDSSC